MTWLGEADGYNGTHLDAGADTCTLEAASGKKARLVRRFDDGSRLVEGTAGNGLKYLRAEDKFKWQKRNSGSNIEGVIVEVLTERCGPAGFKEDKTMRHALRHKEVKAFDISLVYAFLILFFPPRLPYFCLLWHHAYAPLWSHHAHSIGLITVTYACPFLQVQASQRSGAEATGPPSDSRPCARCGI